MSKLIDGRIPALTECPYRQQCPLAENACRHLGAMHPVPFSCASARGYDLNERYPKKEEAKKADVYCGIVLTAVTTIDGETVLETSCRDFEEYKLLPQVVSYQGIICGKTGWSSDRNYACYKSSAAIATTVKVGGK